MPDEIQKKPIADEIATAQKDLDVFSGYLSRLENPDPVLRTEAGGKGLKLYDEVDRDCHAASVLQTRYLAVIGKEWEVIPAEESAGKGRPKTVTRAQAIADFVKDVLSAMNFDQARQEMMQAVLYGFYPAEVMWTVKDNAVVPAKIRAKHPRRFSFTMDRELRLLTPQNMIDGEPVPDRKFIVFSYGSSDNPYGSGLGQKLWWPVWFKKHGIKYWMVFLEKFGMPTTVGKYPPGTPKDQQQKLMDAIKALQKDTGVKIPDSMTMELLEARRTGNVTYESLLDYMDRQISKAVLGQTLTTEVKGEGSYAASQTHNEVRQDIVKADADILCECLNQTLVKWIVDYNFANVDAYPKLWIRTEEEGDLNQRGELDRIIAKDIGVPVAEKYFYETYAIPEPEEGDKLVNPPSDGNNPKKSQDSGAGFAEKKTPNSGDPQDEIDALAGEYTQKAADEVLAAWKLVIQNFLNYIVSDMRQAAEYIHKIYDDLDSGVFAGMLADALLDADRIGFVSDASEFVETAWGPGKPFDSAIEFFNAKAFTIASVTKSDVLSSTKDAIADAMKNGTGIREFRSRVDEIFEKNGLDPLHPWRIDTIFRTNMQSAYQAGRYRQMTSPAVLNARPYWRYVAVKDGSTRPEHAALHGKIFRHDHPFWQTWYPPNGFRCRCTVQTLSAREIERRGWKVETEDPTGTLFEPTDPDTGVKMPARMLMPDPGFSGGGATLEKLLANKDQSGELGRIAWKEKPGQPGPEGLGRPREKDIPQVAWRQSPSKAPSIEDLAVGGITVSQAIGTIEREYKSLMGISPNETTGVLKGHDGETLTVSIASLAHAMLNRTNARERFIRYFRDVIERPYEILLTEYETATGKTKYRKKYIGLYMDENREAVIITAEISPEGWAMWNVMNAKKGTIDRQRRGMKVLYGQ